MPFQINTRAQQILTPHHEQTLVSSFNLGPNIRTDPHLQEHLPNSKIPPTSTNEMSFESDFQFQTPVSEEFYQQAHNAELIMSHESSCSIYTEEASLDSIWGYGWPLHENQQASYTLPLDVLPPDPNTHSSPQYTPSCSSPTSDYLKGQGKSIEPSTKKPRTCLCPDCGKQFSRRAELNRHRNSVHPERLEEQPTLYPCRYLGCSRSGKNGFKRKDNYIQHLRGPHNETIKKRRRGRRNSVNAQDPQQFYAMDTSLDVNFDTNFDTSFGEFEVSDQPLQ